MKNEVVPVQIRGLLPTNSGCAIFVGNDQKVFVIQVEHNLGMIIQMFLQEKTKERPLTHDLIVNVFKGFSISLERVIITELKNSTYSARLILKQDNELGKKLVEIDARPSDCLALAAAQRLREQQRLRHARDLRGHGLLLVGDGVLLPDPPAGAANHEHHGRDRRHAASQIREAILGQQEIGQPVAPALRRLHRELRHSSL